jgi:hypothetical protein
MRVRACLPLESSCLAAILLTVVWCVCVCALQAARESGDIKPEKDKELLAKYDKVHETGHNIPPAIFAKISKWL